MSYDIEITGTLDKSAAEALRRELDDVKVVFASGFAGERVLKILGAASAKHLNAIRSTLLRLLGDNQIGRIKISKNSIEVTNISAKDLDAAKAAIAELIPLLKDAPKK